MNLFEEYTEQYKEFCNIDDFNIEDRAKKIPAEKHFWITRLIEAKKELYNLNKKKKKIKDNLTKKMVDEGVINLSKKTLDDLENTDTIEQLNEKIQDQTLLIEYLELLVKNITFISQDIKNIISLKQLEQ